MHWLRALLVAAIGCLTGTGAGAWGANPQVWFNPHVPLDWMNMWTDSAPWQNAAGKVQVLEIVHWWLDTATDAQILAMTNFAAEHHMKIDFEIQSIELLPNMGCGTTEGYSFPNQLLNEAATLKRLNVTIDMMTMDEPVWFGHYDTDPGSCGFAVADLANNVAANLSAVLALYPNLQLFEIEPIPGVWSEPDWRNSEELFEATLAQASGKQVSGIQMDIGWDTPAWQPAVRAMQQFAHQKNLRFGVIEDPSDVATNNADAVASAVQHFEYMEGTMGLIPDDVIFTTWLQYPQYNMPETDPTAQTWEIDRYFRIRTLLQAQFVGTGVRGKLTTDQGKPIAGATINGYVPGVDFSQPLPTTIAQGVVPGNAVSALLGIRLNDECACSGINDVLIGAMQYQETQGGTSAFSYQYPPVLGSFNGAIVAPETVGGSVVTRFITTTATQSVYPNSAEFPVTPGAQYTFTVPASTIGGDGWYGNVFLLWIDKSGNGLQRVNVIPGPGKRLMSTATTAADGTFRLATLPRVSPGVIPVTVEFAGDATHRSVAWSPLQP